MADNVVYPGTLLGPGDPASADENVHVVDTLAYSAVLGTRVIPPPNGQDRAESCIQKLGELAPSIGATVIAQITKLSRKQAECNIIAVEDKVVLPGYKGIILNTNIHESKTIDTTIYEWFKPGDIVKARVVRCLGALSHVKQISDSDLKQILLSTAHQHLGVIKIDSDEPMIPISWKFFLGTKSGKVEKRLVRGAVLDNVRRKVAKLTPQV